MKICHGCRKEIDPPEPLGRKAVCPFCRAELRCCLNCRFFEPAAYNQCRESQAERVLDKDRANFREYFGFRDSGPSKGGGPAAPARDRLDALFKNS
ncbi:MAG: hypothetical protein LLG93_05955 [Deltaproteobacteria bacterium]|nr:hypothetical protein [Deltaproteobacteria bacterium]